jgi:hypothetical protein
LIPKGENRVPLPGWRGFLQGCLKGSRVSELLILKDWLTVPEAAVQLSSRFDEAITEAHILEWVLEEKLTLLVNLVNGVYARQYKRVERFELTDPTKNIEAPSSLSGGKSRWLPRSGSVLDLGEDDFRQAGRDDLVDLDSGIYNLAMDGFGSLLVRRALQVARGGPPYTRFAVLEAHFSITLRRDDDYFQVLKHCDNQAAFNTEKAQQPKHQLRSHPNNFYPAAALPDDAFFVVCTSELRALVVAAGKATAEEERSPAAANLKTDLKAKPKTSQGIPEEPPDAIVRAVRSQIARTASNVHHDKPGGSREKRALIRAQWATGKFTTRVDCADQESGAIKMSYGTAIKALQNEPEPPGRGSPRLDAARRSDSSKGRKRQK